MKSKDPSAPTLDEALLVSGEDEGLLSVDAEVLMPQAVNVVVEDPPLEPVVPQSLTVDRSMRIPAMALLFSSLILWGGIVFLFGFSDSDTRLFAIIPIVFGGVLYCFSVYKSEVTTYVYSMSMNLKIKDIGNYIENVRSAQDKVSVVVECYHRSSNKGHSTFTGHGKVGRMRNHSNNSSKVVTFREEFDWSNGAFYDRSPISRQAVVDLESMLDAKAFPRSFIEFDTVVSYNFTHEADRDYMALYGSLHSQYANKDEYIDLTKKKINVAAVKKILVPLDGRTNRTQKALISVPGHAMFAVSGLFLFYAVYFDLQTGRCELPFVKSVHYSPAAA